MTNPCTVHEINRCTICVESPPIKGCGCPQHLECPKCRPA